MNYLWYFVRAWGEYLTNDERSALIDDPEELREMYD